MSADAWPRTIQRKHLKVVWSKPFDAAWFRLFGFGFAIHDHRVVRPLFSERNNGKNGVPKRIYLHVGPWCIKFLRPEPSRHRKGQDA